MTVSPVVNCRGEYVFPLIDGPETQFGECLDGFSLSPMSFRALLNVCLGVEWFKVGASEGLWKPIRGIDNGLNPFLSPLCADKL